MFDNLRSPIAKKHGLDLALPGELLGVVVDENDQGVAGATVIAMRRGGGWGVRKLRAVTDERGQFSYPDLAKGAYFLTAVKGTRASRPASRKWLNYLHSGRTTADPALLPLTTPAAQLRVQVIDHKTKEPLSEASVDVSYWELPPKYAVDEAGKVLIQGMLPKSYDISATAPGYAKATEVVRLTAGAQGQLTVSVRRGAVLMGRAVDPEGNPVSNPRPHLRDPADPGMFFDFTPGDAQGAFRFDHAPSQMSFVLDFSKDGYSDPRTTISPLQPGEVREIEVTLTPVPKSPPIVGLVTNEQGEPIVGARVSVIYNDDHMARTNGEGRFRLNDVDRGRDELVVKAPGYAVAVVEFNPASGDEPIEVPVELKPGNRIRGRVLDEAGEPISGVYVRAPTDFQWSAQIERRTNSNGEFQMGQLPDTTRFRISQQGYSGRDNLQLPLNSEEVVDVVLEPQGIIKGLVVDDATGQPLRAFRVRMTFSPDSNANDPSSGIDTDWDHPGRHYSSAEGHFEIDDLNIGQPMIVTVEAPGYRPASIRRVEAARPEAEHRAPFRLQAIKPEELTVVAGILVDAQGKPLPSVELRLAASLAGLVDKQEPIGLSTLKREVRINDQILQMMHGTTDQHGRFRFEGVFADCHVQIGYWGEALLEGMIQDIHKKSRAEQGSLRVIATPPGT